MNIQHKPIIVSSDYRNALAKELRALRKSAFVENKEELVQNLLVQEKAKDIFWTQQEKIRREQEELRFDKRSEKEIARAQIGELIYFGQKFTEDSESKKNVTGKIFLSLHKNEGFRLLKSIDSMLSENTSIPFEVHLLDKFDSKGNPETTKLDIPFIGIPPSREQNQYDLTVAEVMNPSEANKKEHFGEFNTYNGNSGYEYIRLEKKIKENDCGLLQEWAKYLEANPDKSGFYYDHYTTHGDLYDMDHDTPKNDLSKLRPLFEEFLKQKNITLVDDNHDMNRKAVKKVFMRQQKNPETISVTT